MKILKIQLKESKIGNTLCRVIAGHKTYSKMVQILVDKIPNNMVFKKYGSFLYAEKDGYVRIYHHKPLSKDGFAGRHIELNVEGEQKVFKGSLWDPMGYSDMSKVPEYRAVSVTEEPKVMEIGHTFYSGYVTKALYEKLLEEEK